jgi:hypothetical protein
MDARARDLVVHLMAPDAYLVSTAGRISARVGHRCDDEMPGEG